MKVVTVAGIDWQVYPLDVPEQIEFEVIFVQLCGAMFAVAIGATVQGLAPSLVQVLRDLSGGGDHFDIAKLLDLWRSENASEDAEPHGGEHGDGSPDETARAARVFDTRNPRIRAAIETMLDAIADTAGDVIRAGIPAMTDRLTTMSVMRLFEISVLRRCDPVLGGQARKVKDMADLTALLRTGGPKAKWSLLQATIEETYGEGPGAEG